MLGMMDQPYVKERFWGSKAGAFFRGSQGERQIRTRGCASLAEAVLTATSPDLFNGGAAERFQSLSRQVRMTRFGGDCYLYCLLAMGLIDIVAEASLKAFDIAPLVPIIEAAGGIVTTWDGGDPAQRRAHPGRRRSGSARSRHAGADTMTSWVSRSRHR